MRNMLRQLRKRKTMKRILWALVILIIPPFTFWGVGSVVRSKQKGPTGAGAIFGKSVSFEEHNNALQAVNHQAMMMYGSRLSDIYENLNLERQAWERLLLLKEAKRKGLRVKDKEVIETIQNFPFFQSRGIFDNRSYELMIQQIFRIEPRQFEEEMRDSLTIAKLHDSVIKDVKITDEEIKQEYKNENEKSKICYILISPNNFKKNIKTNTEELRKYYQNNLEAFRIPDQINIEYLDFEFAAYQKDIQPTEEQIKKYHNAHKDEFDQKKEFKDLREVAKNRLIEQEARQKALTAAEKIDYILLDKTKSFEEVAKDNSISIKETGFFSSEGPIPHIGWFPEIQASAFKLNVGERSGLIKSNMGLAKGYYIIKIKEKKPSYIPNFDEVKEKVENILKEEKALKLASKEAERLRKKIIGLIKNKNLTFEQAASKTLHNPKYTEPFTRNGYMPGLGSASELGEAAFNAQPGNISPVIKTRAGFCIFSGAEITPIDEEKFKKEKDEFAKKALEAKKLQVLNEWYLNLLKSADIKINISTEEQ